MAKLVHPAQTDPLEQRPDGTDHQRRQYQCRPEADDG